MRETEKTSDSKLQVISTSRDLQGTEFICVFHTVLLHVGIVLLNNGTWHMSWIAVYLKLYLSSFETCKWMMKLMMKCKGQDVLYFVD